MLLAMFGVLWCFLCLLVYDTSCVENSFGTLEAHTTIFEFRNSNLAPDGSFFCNGRKCRLRRCWSYIRGFRVFGCVWSVVVFPVFACV